MSFKKKMYALYINVHLPLPLSQHILPHEHDKIQKCALGPAEKSGIWPTFIVIKSHQLYIITMTMTLVCFQVKEPRTLCSSCLLGLTMDAYICLIFV